MYQNENPIRIEPVIAIEKPVNKNIKFRAPLISLNNKILHSDEKMSGPELVIGNDVA